MRTPTSFGAVHMQISFKGYQFAFRSLNKAHRVRLASVGRSTLGNLVALFAQTYTTNPEPGITTAETP